MQVPEGWEVKKLGELTAKIGSGSTPRGGEASYKTEGIKLIRSQNVLWGSVDFDDVAYIDKAQHTQMKNSTVLFNDVLLNITGASIGRSVIYKDTEEANVNQHVCILRAEKSLSPDFLMSFILSFEGQKQIERHQAGGNRQGLNFQQIAGMKLPLPPLPEQEKIAEILSTWDKAINTTEKLLENSQQQKKSLMQQLLTGKKRLLDETGQRFGGEWKEVSLAHIAQITMGSSPKSSAYNLDKVGLPLIQGNADIENRISAPRIYTSEITKECEVGDVLLSVRAPVGTVALAKHNACIGRGIASIRTNKKSNQNFIYQWLLRFEERWQTFAQGSTFEAINSGDIRSLKINIPLLSEQQKIAEVLTSADQEIEKLEQKLEYLKQEKKALVQQLLTGKKRVKILQV